MLQPDAIRTHPARGLDGLPDGADVVVLATDHGKLIGVNAGEWGGALWIESGGVRRKAIASVSPVVGLVQMKDSSRIVIVTGLAHMTESSGEIHVASLTASGEVAIEASQSLPSAPLAAGAYGDGFLVIFRDRIVVFDDDSHVVRTTILGEALGPLLITGVVAGERRVLVGGRVALADVDLEDGTVRWFVPLDCPSQELCRCIR